MAQSKCGKCGFEIDLAGFKPGDVVECRQCHARMTVGFRPPPNPPVPVPVPAPSIVVAAKVPRTEDGNHAIRQAPNLWSPIPWAIAAGVVVPLCLLIWLIFARPGRVETGVASPAEVKPQKIGALTGGFEDKRPPVAPMKTVPFGTGKDTLAGLEGINVLIEGLHEDAKSAGLDQTSIQTLVELRLRGLGIPVQTRMESLSDTRGAYLYVNIGVVALNDKSGWVFTVNCRLKQDVSLMDQKNEVTMRTVGTTWDAADRFGYLGQKLDLREQINTVLGEMVDAFANDFLAANPKR